MVLFEWILALLLASVALAMLAERLRVPYPSLLAIAGAGLAFLPFAPDIRVEPDLPMNKSAKVKCFLRSALVICLSASVAGR